MCFNGYSFGIVWVLLTRDKSSTLPSKLQKRSRVRIPPSQNANSSRYLIVSQYSVAIDRFKDETLRVFGVLEIRLSGRYTGEPRDYLAGAGKGKYSIADIKTWPWVNVWGKVSGFKGEEMEPFPHVLKWLDRIAERPAVQRGSGPGYNKPTIPPME